MTDAIKPGEVAERLEGLLGASDIELHAYEAKDLAVAVSLIRSQAERIEKLEEALHRIADRFASQDLSHKDFRIEADFIAREALQALERT